MSPNPDRRVCQTLVFLLLFSALTCGVTGCEGDEYKVREMLDVYAPVWRECSAWEKLNREYTSNAANTLKAKHTVDQLKRDTKRVERSAKRFDACWSLWRKAVAKSLKSENISDEIFEPVYTAWKSEQRK